MPESSPLGASFRDPSGRVYRVDGAIVRTVSPSYAEHYELLQSSGLYEALTSGGTMVPHTEEEPAGEFADAFAVIRPQVVPYISYPYEWAFSQLREAALLTLKIADAALDHGMVLKDASAYNVQFFGSRPVFIDTLSFERYVPGEPWIAYRQFCEHFLAPLAVMSFTDVRLSALLRSDLEGIPLDLASALLPGSTKLRPGIAMHVHAHARAQARYADEGGSAAKAQMTETAMRGLVDSLRSTVKGLSWEPPKTEWGDYYGDTNYSEQAIEAKSRIVEEFLQVASPQTVWDLGANTGRFSRLASDRGSYTVAFDIDPAAVEKAYRDARERHDEKLLPLRMDLMNPSPDLGWRLAERDSFSRRGRPDLVLALALAHHLAISRNVPLPSLAEFAAGLSDRLVIEFVPKSDSQVRRLLASRPDIFPEYSREGFEAAFAARFRILEARDVPETERTLYLMEALDARG
jgi:ribosomal protein L11 methylase PrmA